MILTKNQIILSEEDWLSGFMPYGGKGSGAVLKGSKGIMDASNFDPYATFGFARPGFPYVSCTNYDSVASVLMNSVAGTTYDYAIAYNGKLHKIDKSTTPPTVIKTGGVYPYTIAHGAHTGFVGLDGVIYKHNISSTPTYSFFYSFRDATDWDVGCTPGFADGSIDDNYMSDVPADHMTGADLTDGVGLPHPLYVGGDDRLYMGSGRYLHAYDGAIGAEGTFVSKALTLPKGFVIQGMVNFGNYLYIAGDFYGPSSSVYESEALVYVWDYSSYDPTYVINLKDKGVASILMWRGVPTVVTYGNYGHRGNNRVKIINGTTSQTVAEFNGTAPVLRGVINVAGQLLINSAGKIISVGNSYDLNSYEVNQLTSASGNIYSGVLRDLTTTGVNKFIVSSGTSTGYGLDYFASSGYAASATLETPYVEPISDGSFKFKVKDVVVYFKGTASGGRNLTMYLYYDGGTTTSTIFTAKQTVAATELIKKFEYDSSSNPFKPFSNLSTKFVWAETVGGTSTACPIVSKVIINYEPYKI